MILPALFFYLFAAVCVASAVMVIVSMSAGVGAPLQSLVGVAPGGMVPVQFTVRVTPTVVGTVTD